MWQLVADYKLGAPTTLAISTSKKTLEAYMELPHLQGYNTCYSKLKITKLIWNGTVYVPKEENE